MTQQVYNSTAAGFGALASGFVIESLGQVIAWLMCMTAVIVCDLVAGIAKSTKLKERVRFSKAVRDSMAKFCTYYSVCVCACFTQVAAETDVPIAKYSCLIVIFIEACSILSNILKWHGYSLDFIKVISFFASKKMDIDIKPEDVEEMIHKDE